MKNFTALAAAAMILGAPPGALRLAEGSSPQAPAGATEATHGALTRPQLHQLESMIAQHNRVRARLSPSDRVNLDKLTAHVRQELFAAVPPKKLLAAATQIVSRTIPGLSGPAARTLAEYTLGGIAVAQSTGGSRVGRESVSGGSSIGASSAGAASQSELVSATERTQEIQMSFTLQYLRLQNSMQNDNRQFTMVSNIMKTKHNAVKNSIGNIR